MSSKKSFYITSTIFYPNAELHVGHVYTMVVCDIIARYQKLIGNDVRFLTGSDENSGKIVKAAKEKNQGVEEFLNDITASFKKLYADLDVSYDEFIQTTDKEKHWPGAIKMWNKLVESGDIYKSKYIGLYCPNCEAFYTDKDLVEGKCPLHLTIPEKLEEENYFFKLSKYTKDIKEKISSNELEIIPNTRRNEILALLDRGLEDISFSRPAHTVPHGIPVPNDSEQVMYVWCDALTSYMSGVGYGTDEEKFNKYWPADLHVVGKDILRFHAAIWPAMLLSAGLSLPKKLLVHGLITSGGHKMSKSIGNVIDPYQLINEYGADAVRYFVARKLSLFEDSDMTVESFKNAYNGDLANGLGNLVSRIMKMATTNNISIANTGQALAPKEEFLELWSNSLKDFNLKHAIDLIWISIRGADLLIQNHEPYKLIKTNPEKAKSIIEGLLADLYSIAYRLQIFMPETSKEIISSILEDKMPNQLFPRKDA